MSNTFEFDRLKKVIKHDGLSFSQNIGLTLAIFWSLPVVIWLLGIVFSSGDARTITVMERVATINVFLAILFIIAPVRLYRNCNDSRMGIGYAMLPASTLEKFLSMAFYCIIVTPIIYLVGALTIDSILALISSSYEDYAITAYFDDMEQIEYHIYQSMDGHSEEANFMLGLLSPAKLTFMKIFGILATSSIFMFGNMVFKKRKTGKMIGILIILAILFLLLQVKYIDSHESIIRYNMGNKIAAENYIRQLVDTTLNAILMLEIIVSAVMLWGTYHRIKTQKY